MSCDGKLVENGAIKPQKLQCIDLGTGVVASRNSMGLIHYVLSAVVALNPKDKPKSSERDDSTQNHHIMKLYEPVALLH